MRNLLLVAVWLVLSAAAPGQGLNLRLKDLEGKRLELADLYRGRALVVSFWATWCKPCLWELKHFQSLHQAYADSGVAFLAISIDGAKDQGKVRALLSGSRYTFPVALDPEQQAMRKFGLRDVPGTFILDPSGRIAWRHAGYKAGDEKALEEEIKKLIKRPEPDSANAGALEQEK